MSKKSDLNKAVEQLVNTLENKVKIAAHDYSIGIMSEPKTDELQEVIIYLHAKGFAKNKDIVSLCKSGFCGIKLSCKYIGRISALGENV